MSHGSEIVQTWTNDPNSLFARIKPNLPKEAPKNILLSALEKVDPESDRRRFALTEGFVPVTNRTGQYLKRVHMNGEPTERGGTGPLLFDVLPAAEAAQVTQEEQRRAMLKGTGSIQHVELNAFLAAQQAEMGASFDGKFSVLEARIEARVERTEQAVTQVSDRLDRLANLLERFMAGGATPPAPQSQAESSVTVRRATEDAVALDARRAQERTIAAPEKPQERASVAAKTQPPMTSDEAQSRGLLGEDGTVLDFAELARGSA